MIRLLPSSWTGRRKRLVPADARRTPWGTAAALFGLALLAVVALVWIVWAPWAPVPRQPISAPALAAAPPNHLQEEPMDDDSPEGSTTRSNGPGIQASGGFSVH